MHNRLLRPLLIVEFLIAIQAIFTIWSQVGGQYHLDLMFWPWKLGLSLASAGLIVAITANLVRNEGQITRRAVLFCSILIAVLLAAGVVTYYYHLNEPTDQDEDQDDSPAKISRIVSGRGQQVDGGADHRLSASATSAAGRPHRTMVCSTERQSRIFNSKARNIPLASALSASATLAAGQS